jgi:hypothetical protein
LQKLLNNIENQKKKWKRNKKRRKARGTVSAKAYFRPTAQLGTEPNRYDPLFPPTLTTLAHLSSPSSGQDFSPRTSAPSTVDLASRERNPSLFFKLTASINSPGKSRPSPFRLSAQAAARTARSLVGSLHIYGRHRRNSSPVVSPSSHSPFYPLPLDLVHLPDHFTPCNSQQDEQTIASPKLSSARGPPAASLSFIWTRSSRPSPPSDPSRRAGCRHDLFVVQRSSQARRQFLARNLT